MASIIQGYEYDVFISYRQNDNKYDGWVTNFVNNLSLELEATIKDKISVYFDTNPHDGLLETHTVDKSLEDKLKCLIFIPIISKTYCDITSFAWKHEFCVFNRLALDDKFGRDIRLSRGNFASRILPVRIHELNPEDILLVENELGGSLRSIDFIFKAAGVNRPLRDNEDHPHDNVNSTYYRDQINKVANAISEIISVLRYESAVKIAVDTKASENVQKKPGTEERRGLFPTRSYSKGSKILLTGIIIITILSVVLKLISQESFKLPWARGSGSAEDKISITVMPFNNLTNDSTLQYLTIGVQDVLVNTLSFYPEDFKIRTFDLIRNSFRNEKIPDFTSITPVTGSNISKKLDADYFILGEIYKTGEKIRIGAQLINSKTEEIVRSFKEEGISPEIMRTIDTLSIDVKNYLLLAKINEETDRSRVTDLNKSQYLTGNPDAFRYHILAREALINLDYNTAIQLDLKAINIDSGYMAAMVTLCWGNYYLGEYEIAKKWLQKAYKSRERFPMIQQIMLDYEYALLFENPVEQIKYLKQLQKMEDNDPRYYQLLGYLYASLHNYDEAIPELEKAKQLYEKLDGKPTDLFFYHFLSIAYNKTGNVKKLKKILESAEQFLTENSKEANPGDRYYKMAIIYSGAGLFDKAEEFFRKGTSMNPGNTGMLYQYAYSLINYDLNVKRGLELVTSELDKDSTNGILIDLKGWGFYRQHKYDDALKLLEKAYQLIPSAEIKIHLDSVKAAISAEK